MSAIAIPIDPVARPAEWLDRRRSRSGASEAAAACGLSRRTSRLELYLRKTGELLDEPPSDQMRLGLHLEPFIARLYEERTGVALDRRQIYLERDADGVPLCATLDAVRDDERPVELKWVGPYSPLARELGEEDSDEVPVDWLCQAHQQMIVAGTDRVDIAALVGGPPLRIFTVERNDLAHAGLLANLARFWEHVRRREPPEPDRPADARLVAALYPPTGEEVVLDFTAAEFAAEWERLGPMIRDLAKRRDMLKAQLVHRLAGAVGVLPDGRRLRHDVREVAERTQTVRAYRSSTLRIVKGRE